MSRPAGRLPGPEGRALTEEQAAVVADRDGPLMVVASAGSGKTTVLVERFVRHVVDDGIDPRAILAITFTRRAAGELRRRIRERFVELGCVEHARAMEGAWVTTIDGFCLRLLSAHAVIAGLDPRLRVLDAAELRGLRERAFEGALGRALGPPGARPADALVDLLDRLGYDGLGGVVSGLYDELRSAGQAVPRLPDPPPGRAEDERLRPLLGALDGLLAGFGASLAAAKRERHGLDFADLAVAARDLLRGHPEVAASQRERLQRVMVDEFQDTNRLQLEVLEALGQEHLFTVGDRLQSIYAFRHADVGVFAERERAARARGRVRTLATNFRARPEILALVNAAFGGAHEGYVPLRAGRTPPDGPTPSVELLLADAAAWKALDGDDPRRAALSAGMPDAPLPVLAEARLVARRVAELVAAGREPGEIVVLLRAGTHMPSFERALELAGVPAVAAQGRGWWTRRELQDLLNHLRVVGNPLDEEALLGVLAGPLVRFGADELGLLALERRRRGAADLWTVASAAADGDEGGLLGRIGPPARERLRTWRALAGRDRRALGAAGPAELLERVLAATGYEQETLRGAGGARRIANVRKLVRLADAFEARAGRDLRAFIDHAAAELDAGEPTPDAPIDLGEAEAVRVMTVHGAKGLEFPVVVVADLGRAGANPAPPVVLVERDPGGPGAAGLRLPTVDGGEREEAFAYDRLDTRRRASEEEEERRIIHVAVTRAEELLVLSGTFEPERGWGDPGLRRPAFAWMGPGLFPDGRGPAGGRVRVGDAEFDVRVDRPAPDEAPARPGVEAPGAGAPGPAAPPPGAVALPALEAPAPGAPATLSYTSLSDFARCGYGWYLRRVLSLPPRDPGRLAALVPGEAGAALLRGSIAHALLETADLRLGAAPPTADEVRAAAARFGAEPGDAEISDQLELAAGFLAGPLRERAAVALRLRREAGFALALDPADEASPLLTGVIDLLAEERDGAVLVVDYKTDRVGPGDDLEALVGRDYAIQRALYALAVLRSGAPAVEIAHAYLERGAHASARFTGADLPALEARVQEASAPLLAGRYPVSERPWAGLCATCPGRGGACPWPEEASSAPAPPGGQAALPV